ncbi:MAG TPA: hypothetical protein VGI43_16925 [Mucilaginibacter sp.]|jgi:hypothetical protein
MSGDSKERKNPKDGKSESREVVKKSEVGGLKSEDQTVEERPKSETSKPSLTPIKNKQPLKIEHFQKESFGPMSEIKNKSEIVNLKSQIEKMEVHHHPEIEKKGFKEYILEGLMIFLAVMMGFIAENIREGISEHKRASEFARSYFEDVKKDTAALYAAQRFSNHKIAALDSALVMLHYPAAKQNDTLLYRRLSTTSNTMPFEPSAGTYEQIKSSGSLRYFDQKLVNLMNGYDVQVKKTVKREDIDLKFILEQVMPFGIKSFNTEVVYDVYFSPKISHELYFSDKSQATIRQLINYTVIVKIERMRAQAEYKKQLKLAGDVLTELKKEYNLEDE